MGSARYEEDEGASEDDQRVQDERGAEPDPLRQPGVRGGLEGGRDASENGKCGEQDLHRHHVSPEERESAAITLLRGDQRPTRRQYAS
jgi:hypothetical protein